MDFCNKRTKEITIYCWYIAYSSFNTSIIQPNRASILNKQYKMELEFINEQPEEEKTQELPKQTIWDTKEYLEFVKHYAEDDNIPKAIRTSKWGIFGKALTYTFLDERDLPMIDIFSNILRIDALIAQPAHKVTFGEVHILDQSQFYLFLTAKRAIGTNREKMNERTLQNTQIAQTIATQTAMT